MYDIIKDYLLQICYDLPRGKLILCGGIEVNMNEPCEDFFEPHFFEVHENGTKTLDLMHVFEREMAYE